MGIIKLYSFVNDTGIWFGIMIISVILWVGGIYVAIAAAFIQRGTKKGGG